METLDDAEREALAAWLTECGYGSVEEWAADSDYIRHPETDEWYLENYGAYESAPVDIESCAFAAMQTAAES